MTNIQFDQEQGTSYRHTPNRRQPKGLSAKLISWGVAKDVAGAQKIMLIIIIVSILLIILLNINFQIGGKESYDPAVTNPSLTL